MNDERYERSADMRLLDLRRAALGMPPRKLVSTAHSNVYAPADHTKNEDETYVQSGTVLIASIDAQPRTGLIAGALVTVSLSVVNDGDLAGRNVRMSLALPVDTVYRAGTLSIDGTASRDDTAHDLFENGADLGDIGPGVRRTLVLKIVIEAGPNDLILAPHLSVVSGAVLGLRAMRLTRKPPAIPSLLVERPFYESDEIEHIAEPLEPIAPRSSISVLQPVEFPTVRQQTPPPDAEIERTRKAGPKHEPVPHVVATPAPSPEQRLAHVVTEPERNPSAVPQVERDPHVAAAPERSAQITAEPERKPQVTQRANPIAPEVKELISRRATEPATPQTTPDVMTKRAAERVAKFVAGTNVERAPQNAIPMAASPAPPVTSAPPATPATAATPATSPMPATSGAPVMPATSATELPAKRVEPPITDSIAKRTAERIAQFVAEAIAKAPPPQVAISVATEAARPSTARPPAARTVAKSVSGSITKRTKSEAPPEAVPKRNAAKAKSKSADQPKQKRAPRPKIEVVRSADDHVAFTGQGGPMLAVRIDKKRLTTLTGLFKGPSLGMIAHYLVLNALAARDPLPGDGRDTSIAQFVASQEQLLSRALISVRLGKTPTAESVGAALPAFPPDLATHTERRSIDTPPAGEAMLFRAFQPAEVMFVKRMLSNEKAAPFTRAAQLFVGLCANDAVLADEHARLRAGIALTAYAALATAEISRIFLAAKAGVEPDLFRATSTEFDEAARTVLAAIARSTAA